jgi:hypothetical protein
MDRTASGEEKKERKSSSDARPRRRRGVEVEIHLFLTSALDGGMDILKKTDDLLPMPRFEP